MNSLFIDSDILIDLLAQREHHVEAAALMTIIGEKKITAYTTPIVLANVDYIITKYSNKAKSRKAIRALRKMLSILPMDEKVVDMALESEFSDFEDALQYYAAEKRGIDFIITRNKRDYSKGSLKVITAQEYINMVESNG
ncbi:MAG: PIN domain-containing protein [Deltaproteobacteria bacterium]|nr:PIN domain-containing protein [Deltaproteobacteria bacterium]